MLRKILELLGLKNPSEIIASAPLPKVVPYDPPVQPVAEVAQTDEIFKAEEPPKVATLYAEKPAAPAKRSRAPRQKEQSKNKSKKSTKK